MLYVCTYDWLTFIWHEHAQSLHIIYGLYGNVVLAEWMKWKDQSKEKFAMYVRKGSHKKNSNCSNPSFKTILTKLGSITTDRIE